MAIFLSETETRGASSRWDAVFRLLRWLPVYRQLGDTRGLLVVIGVVCQCVTVWITWPLWQVRSDVPHLGLFDLPQMPFAGPMMLSSAAVLVCPRIGIGMHWLVLIAASVFDQYRLQPQFFLIALLIHACISPRVKIVSRWLIASTWFWAGLHKLLSPDWFGHASHWLVNRTGLDADRWYITFALVVGISEIVLGVLACIRPRWAACLAAPLHLGIIGFLLWIDWNASVIPWNFLMATTGGWIMWTADLGGISRRWSLCLAATCFVYPIGFYYGWVDHGFAGVLYSDWLPSGQVTTKEGTHFINGWGKLNVPFPNERRLLRLYFEQYAEPGDKLHISDPRDALEDQFFVLDAAGRSRSLDIDDFLVPQAHIPASRETGETTVAGIGIDEKRAVFALSAAGVRMVRPEAGKAIFAVEIPPENYQPRLLELLEGLPNLMQIQLAGTSVRDVDLIPLVKLRLLTGLGLANTDVTDDGIRPLRDLPHLQHIEHDGTSISTDALNDVVKNPFSW